MRNLLIVVLVLSVAVSAGARNMEGSYVEMLSPASIAPGETFLFEFGVYNASLDSEWLTDVLITFPDGWVISWKKDHAQCRECWRDEQTARFRRAILPFGLAEASPKAVASALLAAAGSRRLEMLRERRVSHYETL